MTFQLYRASLHLGVESTLRVCPSWLGSPCSTNTFQPAEAGRQRPPHILGGGAAGAGLGALGATRLESGAFSLGRCVFPYYCPQGSTHPFGCPGGSEALNKSGLRVSAETSCRLCAAGTYRSPTLDTLTCQPCPPGFICPQGEYHLGKDR